MLEFGNVTNFLHVRRIATSTKDDAHLCVRINVMRGHESTGRVVDQAYYLDGYFLTFRRISSGWKGLALWTDKLIQAFLEHLDNVLTFDTWSAKAFCPAQQDTVINLFLTVESIFKQYHSALRRIPTCMGMRR